MVSEHDSRTLSSAPHDSVHDSEITINKGTTPIRGSEPRVKKNFFNDAWGTGRTNEHSRVYRD